MVPAELKSVISLADLILPDVTKWKLVPSLKPDEDLVYFCFEFITTDTWQVIRKAAKIDCKTGEVTFKVYEKQCVVATDCSLFDNKDRLEAILLYFHNASICCGITDPKYAALGIRPVESGSFDNDIWRSTT